MKIIVSIHMNQTNTPHIRLKSSALMNESCHHAYLLRLLQFTDSAFPVGSFSFSNGLETAAQQGLVYDVATLQQYVQTLTTQLSTSDCVAALHAHRAVLQSEKAGVIDADKQLLLMKTNNEARMMLCRMGRKMAQQGALLLKHSLLAWWNEQIALERTPGTYPISQAVVFAVADLSEEDLFSAQLYGTMSLVLNAALRCVKVSHRDTQQILFELGNGLSALYEKVRNLSLEEMHTFLPQTDILASLHEKGYMRMFMN